jgi:hypothetical protein
MKALRAAGFGRSVWCVCTLWAVPAVLVCAVLWASAAGVAWGDVLVGEGGYGAGQLATPSGVAIDQASGEVFVVESGASRISVFSTTGQFLRAFGFGVVDGSERLEVCTSVTGCQRGVSGSQPGQLGGKKVSGMKIAVDQATGEVYVFDAENFRVEQFTSMGEWRSMFGDEVNKSTKGNVCTASNVQEADVCGAGLPGIEPGDLGTEEPLEKPLEYEPTAEQIWTAAGEREESPGEEVDARIEKFTAAGTFAEELGPIGLKHIILLAPVGAGAFFAAEGEVSAAQKIFKYDAAGSKICTVADQFAQEDGSVRHHGLAFDVKTGELMVYDTASAAGVPTSGVLSFNGNCEETRQWDHKSGSREVFPANNMAVDETTQKVYATGSFAGYGLRITEAPQPGPEPGTLECGKALAGSLGVKGMVDPEGNSTEAWFEYVDGKSFEEHGFAEASRTPAQDAGEDFEEREVSATIGGLTANTTYHVRLAAKNSEGEQSVAIVCATVPAAAISLLPIAEPGTSSAQASGYVNPEDLSTSAWFEYWPAGGGAAISTPRVSVGPEPEDGFALLSAHFTGLVADSSYDYRLVAENSAGSVVGGTQTFTTAGGKCPNEGVRFGLSNMLGECRAYEMVSPVNKGGVPPVGPIAIENAGNGVAYYSKLPFPGSASGAYGEYVSRRGQAGWSNEAVMPAMTARSTQGLAIDLPFIRLMSSDLNREAIETAYPLSPEAQGYHQPGEPSGGGSQPNQVYLRDAGGALEWLSAPPTLPDLYPYDSEVVGGTPDLRHVLIATSKPLTAAARGATTVNLYEWSEGHIETVNVSEQGTLLPCNAGAGGAPNPNPLQAQEGNPILGQVVFPSAISSDGGVVYFTCGTVLYARHDGYTSIVSLSQRTGATETPAAAQFLAASSDGQQAVFYSEEQLTNDATHGGGIYQYNLQTGLLTFAGGLPASVRNREVIGASPDLSYLYFQTGEHPRYEIYMLHNSVLSHITTVESGTGNPSGEEQTSMSPNGQYLAFVSGTRIGGYDNHGTGEIYEYDATTDTISCVSCHPDGSAPIAGGGNRLEPANPGPYAYAIRPPQLHVVANTGAVFFDSTEPLLTRDNNRQENVYEYNHGQLSPISTGTSNTPSAIFGIANEGQDVYILTSQTLTPTDTDGGLADIYDARIGGGYPPPQQPTPCQEPTCRALSSQELAPLFTPIILSNLFAGNGNQTINSKPITKSHHHKHHATKHKHHHTHRKRRRRG